jgi:hypothetical protein
MARMKSFRAGFSDFRIAFIRLIRVIYSPLVFLSIRAYSCPFVVGFLRLYFVGPEKLPHSYRVDCD